MQQKLDGARMVVKITRGLQDNRDILDFLFSNDGEHPIAFSAAKLKTVMLEDDLVDMMAYWGLDEVILDGELIIDTGEYWVFDILYASAPWNKEMVRPEFAWNYRHGELVSLFKECGDNAPLVHLSPTAISEDEKRAMWAAIQVTGVEGAVSKLLTSPYVPGIRTTDWVKHKLVKTADVIVSSVRRTFKPDGRTVHTGAAELEVNISPFDDPRPYRNMITDRRITPEERDALLSGTKAQQAKGLGYTWDGRDRLSVGAASLIGKDLTIDVGDVAEIEYLYWTGQAVIQPRITRKRVDKPAADCDMTQFPEYTRQVVGRSV
jgi:hypothetical protein